jgi:prevent-host-death family protein
MRQTVNIAEVLCALKRALRSRQPEPLISLGGCLASGLFSDYIWSSLVHDRLPVDMRYSTQIKPISYLKANAAEVLKELTEQRRPLVITQNGEAKAVIQDVASYEETQETLALLKILALGNQQVEQGKVKRVSDVVNRLREQPKGD